MVTSIDTFDNVAATSTSVRLFVKGTGLIKVPKSTSVALGLMISNGVISTIFIQKKKKLLKNTLGEHNRLIFVSTEYKEKLCYKFHSIEKNMILFIKFYEKQNDENNVGFFS